MNGDETVELLELIAVYAPREVPDDPRKLAQFAAVWAEDLADISAGEAIAAVRSHYRRTQEPWMSVAKVRQLVAGRRGILPPDAETALAQAREFDRWLDRRVGPEPPIHPAALTAARTIEWSTFAKPDGVLRKAFGTAYQTAAEAVMERIGDGEMDSVAAEIASPSKALTGGAGALPTVEWKAIPVSPRTRALLGPLADRKALTP